MTSAGGVPEDATFSALGHVVGVVWVSVRVVFVGCSKVG